MLGMRRIRELWLVLNGRAHCRSPGPGCTPRPHELPLRCGAGVLRLSRSSLALGEGLGDVESNVVVRHAVHPFVRHPHRVVLQMAGLDDETTGVTLVIEQHFVDVPDRLAFTV